MNDGKKASGCKYINMKICIWDLNTNQCNLSLKGHEDRIIHLIQLVSFSNKTKYEIKHFMFCCVNKIKVFATDKRHNNTIPRKKCRTALCEYDVNSTEGNNMTCSMFE